MTEADAKELVAKYGVSWFRETDHIDPANICSRRGVPVLAGPELVAAMLENVDESHTATEGTRARLGRAVHDGLVKGDGTVDEDMVGAFSRDLRKLFRAAAQTVVGDHQRAIAELRHWREYVRWAQDLARNATVAKPAHAGPVNGASVDIRSQVAALASAKALGPEDERR